MAVVALEPSFGKAAAGFAPKDGIFGVTAPGVVAVGAAAAADFATKAGIFAAPVVGVGGVAEGTPAAGVAAPVFGVAAPVAAPVAATVVAPVVAGAVLAGVGVLVLPGAAATTLAAVVLALALRSMGGGAVTLAGTKGGERGAGGGFISLSITFCADAGALNGTLMPNDCDVMGDGEESAGALAPLALVLAIPLGFAALAGVEAADVAGVDDVEDGLEAAANLVRRFNPNE